jgi:predicted nucleic acid-binding protein
MLTHLLDTSIYCQRLRPAPLPSVIKKWKNCGDHCLAISGICEAELLYGLDKRQSDRLWLEYRHYLEDRLALLPVDKNVAATYGKIKTAMEADGQPRADFDLLIAATAITHNLTLATLNILHFTGIPGLKCEVW